MGCHDPGPAEIVDRTFDALLTTKSQGTGLSLAITRSMVKSHGSRIWATSNSGCGATFKFTCQVQWPQRQELSRYSDCVVEHSECDLQLNELIISCGLTSLMTKGLGPQNTRWAEVLTFSHDVTDDAMRLCLQVGTGNYPFHCRITRWSDLGH